MVRRVAFVGYGQVAATLAPVLVAHGAAISAYDILLDDPPRWDILRARGAGADVMFAPLHEAVEHSDYVFSTVTTDAALPAAQQAAAYLTPRQMYVDLNATSPRVKSAIAEVIIASGARFVEGAVLDAIDASGARVRILCGGPCGEQAAADLFALGLNAAFFRRDIGAASTFKMLRSILSKGMEALLLEWMLAGERAGLSDVLWADMMGFLERTTFERAAEAWMRSHARACTRRYHEMTQVIETMRELGVDPLMTTATEAFFARSARLGLATTTAQPVSARDVVGALLAQLQHEADGVKGE